MIQFDIFQTEDDIIQAIRDLRKLIFLSECYDLYRRDQIPNLRHNSCYYTEELLDELQIDLLDLMNQQARDLDVLTDNLFEWYRECQSESRGDSAPHERAPRAGGASPTDEISSS